MKKFLYTLSCLTIAFWLTGGNIVNAQGEAYWTESWNDVIDGQLTGTTSEAPAVLTEVTQRTGIWQALRAIRGGSNMCDGTGKTLRLLKISEGQGGVVITPAVDRGVDTVTFVEGRGGDRNIAVSKSVDNGATWEVVATLDSTVKCEVNVIAVNDANATHIKFENVGTGDVDIDDITLTTVEAASEVVELDFENYKIGDAFGSIGWSAADLEAVAAADPLADGNYVLQCTVNNYNAAPVLEFTLPAGKTLADYTTFKFKAYFAQGDVGWKDIVVEAYQAMPTAQAYNNADVKIGSWNRASGASTAWEDITIDITNTSAISGKFYVAFGINCAGTGDQGGAGLTTIWYADDIMLEGEEEEPPLPGDVILSDEFDNGDSKWSSGWIDAANTSVAVSIDNTGILSGDNSYKIEVTNGGVEMWRIQRNANCPLLPGNKYTVSFMAVASQEAYINVLFEIAGDPYTKRLDDTVTVTTDPQTFTFVVSSFEAVPDNMLKFMLGSQRNNGATIWMDKIVVTESENTDLVSAWGGSLEYGVKWPTLNDTTYLDGDASMGSGTPPDGWSALKGGFATLNATTSEAVVISGKFEFVGGGASENGYTPFRYSLTYQENVVLQNQYTDSAAWA
ncbi:MAG: carbohydrate binding domain-containing protein, partial [Melioribacteraceae bacterium]|nr:carbohydrate binding domain-containing protein [Melioribacteraceae bacterium]